MSRKPKVELSEQEKQLRASKLRAERRDRFRRIAPRRVKSLAKAMDAVGRLGNPQTYQMEDGEREKLAQYVSECFDAMIDALSHKQGGRPEFTL